MADIGTFSVLINTVFTAAGLFYLFMYLFFG